MKKRRSLIIPAATTLLAIACIFASCEQQPRSFKRPASLSLGADGSIFVSDFHNHRIVHLGPDGSLVRAFGELGLETDQLWQAWDVLAVRDGRVLVLNQRITAPEDETNIYEIKEFKDGKEIALHRISDGVSDPSGLPDGLAEGRDGEWLVPDTGNHTLRRFSRGWQPLEQIHGPTGGPEFAGLSMLLRSGDELWTLEQHAHQVRRLTLRLREEARFGERGRAPGKLMFPSGLGVCRGKWIAVADFGNHRVQRFHRDGAYLDGFSPARASEHTPTMLLAIAVTPDCQRLVMVDSKGNRVLVTTTQGRVLRDIRSW